MTGTNFTGAREVDFGNSPATSFTVVSATEVTAVSPAGSGAVDVTVATPSGRSATSAADRFTYGSASVPPFASVLGYHEVAADGGVFSFNAPFFGSMAGKPLD
ncbi:IPT/TIG domain-containing protein, partial [Aciditerrimonas ferrireducens]